VKKSNAVAGAGSASTVGLRSYMWIILNHASVLKKERIGNSKGDKPNKKLKKKKRKELKKFRKLDDFFLYFN
jgi:hypothetical protein